MIRFKETGKICCGDYLNDKESSAGYLTDMGLFIKFMFILFLIAICVALCVIFSASISVFLRRFTPWLRRLLAAGPAAT